MLQAAFSIDSHIKRGAQIQSDRIFEVFSSTLPPIYPLESAHIQNCYSSSRSSSSGTWQAAAPHWWQFPSSCSSEQTKCDRQANRQEKESSEQKCKLQKLLSEEEKIISTANNAMSLREYAVRA